MANDAVGFSLCPEIEEKASKRPLRSGSAEGRAAAPWLTTHISALHSWRGLQGSGTLLRAVNPSAKHRRVGGLRGTIGHTPSAGTNWRYCQRMAATPWDSYERTRLYMGNLTYHAIPGDGVKCKDDFRSWCRALDRILGGRDKYGLFWVMEFQRRGSLHFHYVLLTSESMTGEQFWAIRGAWLRITGESEDIWALQYGVTVSMVRDIRAVKCYESKYMGKFGRDNAKAYEKVAPAWFTNCGRWWGVVGTSLDPCYETFQVQTSEEWFTVKRLLRSYAHSVTSGRYTPHTMSGDNGQTVLGHGGDLEAFHELIRWLTMQRLTVSAVGNARDAILYIKGEQ